MGNPDLKRIQAQEGAYTFTNHNTAKMFKEIDARMNGANVFTDITRTAGLISKIEYFSEIGRSNLRMELNILYAGGDMTSFTWIFYNDDATEDSRVVETTTRNIDDDITTCDSVFSTTESTKL